MDNQTEPKLVWLDCDPGTDDAIAIFLAASSPKLKLLGISTVQGNTHVENSTKNALSLLHIAGIQGIDVYRGQENSLTRGKFCSDDFHGSNGMAGMVLPTSSQKEIRDDVFNKIYSILKSQGKKIHFIATGALTNLAILLTIYPDIKQYIEQISIMGGSITLGNSTPAAEFNIQMDPEAAKIVFDAQIPLAMCPLDLTLKVKVDENIVSKIQQLKSKFSECVVKFLQFYLQSYKKTFNFDYAPLHDPCAVYYVVNPGAFKTKFKNVVIETKSEYCDGRTVVDEYGTTGRKPNCTICYDMDQEQFWSEMMSALAQCNQNSPL
ncbi:hypothetical protein ABPG74_015504 [Tetrahymena malaccensis]